MESRTFLAYKKNSQDGKRLGYFGMIIQLFLIQQA